jgi:hypothetical protein
MVRPTSMPLLRQSTKRRKLGRPFSLKMGMVSSGSLLFCNQDGKVHEYLCTFDGKELICCARKNPMNFRKGTKCIKMEIGKYWTVKEDSHSIYALNSKTDTHMAFCEKVTGRIQHVWACNKSEKQEWLFYFKLASLATYHKLASDRSSVISL